MKWFWKLFPTESSNSESLFTSLCLCLEILQVHYKFLCHQNMNHGISLVKNPLLWAQGQDYSEYYIFALFFYKYLKIQHSLEAHKITKISKISRLTWTR